MSDPRYLFGTIGALSGLIAVVIWLTKFQRYRTATKTIGQVTGGHWIKVNPGLPSEQNVWQPTITYENANGQLREFSPQFGMRPEDMGRTVQVLVFPNGEAMLNGFREKWIWVIIFAIPAVFFVPAMFLMR